MVKNIKTRYKAIIIAFTVLLIFLAFINNNPFKQPKDQTQKTNLQDTLFKVDGFYFNEIYELNVGDVIYNDKKDNTRRFLMASGTNSLGYKYIIYRKDILQLDGSVNKEKSVTILAINDLDDKNTTVLSFKSTNTKEDLDLILNLVNKIQVHN